MKSFLAYTQISSRILFGIWSVLMFFSALGSEFLSSSLYICWLLLGPIIFIELRKNPILRPQGFLGEYPICSLICYWYGLGLAFQVLVYCTTKDPNAPFFVVAPIAAFPFWLAGFVWQKAIKYRNKDNKTSYENEKLFPRWGAFGVFCLIIALTSFYRFVKGLDSDATCGVVFSLLMLFAFVKQGNAPKTIAEKTARQRAEFERKQKEREIKEKQKRLQSYGQIFMDIDEVDQIEKGTSLPRLSVPVFLRLNEVAVFHGAAKRQETKSRVVGRRGNYGGASIRVAKGLYLHGGGSKGTSIYGNVSTHYEGELILTNQRLVFLNDQRAFEIEMNAVTAWTNYSDGFYVQVKNQSYTVLLDSMPLFLKALDGLENNVPFGQSNELSYTSGTPKAGSNFDAMNGHEFEYFCANLLRENGFDGVEVTPGSGDQGVDIIAIKEGVKYAIQCKCYAQPLGNSPVQEVHAGKSFYQCHVGVVMTNSTFTPGAKALARKTGVLLWDRSHLLKLIEE